MDIEFIFLMTSHINNVQWKKLEDAFKSHKLNWWLTQIVWEAITSELDPYLGVWWKDNMPRVHMHKLLYYSAICPPSIVHWLISFTDLFEFVEIEDCCNFSLGFGGFNWSFFGTVTLFSSEFKLFKGVAVGSTSG